MALGEFDLIDHYFNRPRPTRQPLGIGDDCALLAPRPGMQLAVSTDMLVEGRHFFADVDPARLGHKALAVNLSDLAACGAEPLAYTLALALPRADERFLAAFASGLHALADRHEIELIGGDTTAGPLNLCITVFGEVPTGQALLRSGAEPGDDLWVSGRLGDARLALEALLGQYPQPPEVLAATRDALERPEPRVALGRALRGLAHSALDVSDGLLGDLGHLLDRSQARCGTPLAAVIELTQLPRSAALSAQPEALQQLCLLSGGDDYELLFSAAPEDRERVMRAGETAGTAVTRIGRIEAATAGQPRVRVLDGSGVPLATTPWRSFDHFG
jgi:thiamine-monophosphate kinase